MSKSAHIEKLLLSGLTPHEIVTAASCSNSLVSHVRQRIGLPKFSRGRPINQHILELIQSGYRPFEIENKLGCPSSLVTHYRKKLGLPSLPAGRNQRSHKHKAEMEALRSSGLNLKKIADKFGCTRQCIDQILNPAKARARSTVSWLVRSGKIKKPRKCQKCGGKKPQAHHPDYSRPAFIKWLCTVCHGAAHRRLKD